MDLLKRHYEKLLLSLVLLVLAGTAVWLFIAIEKKREEVQVQVTPTSKPREMTPADVSLYVSALQKAKAPAPVKLNAPHFLFNPSTWKQRPDGSLMKMVSSNPADALALLKVTPLHLIINFERAAGTGYYFGITREAAPRPSDRKKVQRYLNPGGKSELFVLKKVEGSADNPERFILELNENKQEIVITPAQPFSRIEGYAADMKYELENKSFADQRVGATVNFAGESYKVVAINENEVRVHANSNQKQTTVRLKPAP
jgi:hypothetical protein